MGWLGTRLRKKPSEEEVVEEELEPEPPSGPPLVLLVPEIAGGSSYRLHRFHDLEQAVEVIESTIPAIRAGIHAFWALHERPLDSTDMDPKGEGMVLIRTNAESDVVYVVSFVDIESGESFARFEVKRGLDLGFVMIYWAAHVEIDQTGAGFTLTPPEPPATATSERRPLRDWSRPAPVAARPAVAEVSPDPPVAEDVATDVPDISDSVAVTASPAAETPARREAEEAEGRYRQDEAEAAGMIEEEPGEPQAVTDLPSLAATNGNGVNGHAIELEPEPLAVEERAQPEPVEAIEASEPETLAAYAGDEEIAERILQEALGDGPIDLVSPGSAAGTEVKDAADEDGLAEPPVQAAEEEPELDLFNGPPKTTRRGKKAKPDVTPEMAAAMTPEAEPEAPVGEDFASGEVTPEAVLPAAAAAEVENATAQEATIEDEPVAAPAPEAATAGTVPVAEPAVFTPEPAPAAAPEPEPQPIFTPVEPEPEPQPIFTPAESEPERKSIFLPREEGSVPAAAASASAEPADEDAVAQVEKILRIPRWEKKEDPFKGFNSPPGRF